MGRRRRVVVAVVVLAACLVLTYAGRLTEYRRAEALPGSPDVLDPPPPPRAAASGLDSGALEGRRDAGAPPRTASRGAYLAQLLAQSSNDRVRTQAALSLATTDDASAARTGLLRALGDEDPRVREAVARSLGTIGELADVSSVESALATERDPLVQRALSAAIVAIEARDPTASIPGTR